MFGPTWLQKSRLCQTGDDEAKSDYTNPRLTFHVTNLSLIVTPMQLPLSSLREDKGDTSTIVSVVSDILNITFSLLGQFGVPFKTSLRIDVFLLPLIIRVFVCSQRVLK